MNETLAVVETSGLVGSAEPYSVAWWESRTAEELRDIIKRGFAGGDAFQGAVEEAERRAREATRQLREAAAREAERSRKLKLFILASAALAAAVIFVSATWL